MCRSLEIMGFDLIGGKVKKKKVVVWIMDRLDTKYEVEGEQQRFSYKISFDKDKLHGWLTEQGHTKSSEGEQKWGETPWFGFNKVECIGVKDDTFVIVVGSNQRKIRLYGKQFEIFLQKLGYSK